MSTAAPGNNDDDDSSSRHRAKHANGSQETTPETQAQDTRVHNTADTPTQAYNTEHTRSREHTASPTAAVPVSHTKHPDDVRRDTYDDRPAVPATAERQALHDREKEMFGGMKFGAAFFGWLTATGMAVLLTALVAGAGAVLGLSTSTTVNEASSQASQNAQTVGITGAIILLVILLLAYFAGGYVAGRMSRFNGAKQGVAVWLWAVIMAVLVAVLGLIFGSRFDVFAQLNSFPRLPINEGDLTTAGIIAVVTAALAALAGAVLGGMTGMRYHRRIDRADYAAEDAQR